MKNYDKKKKRVDNDYVNKVLDAVRVALEKPGQEMGTLTTRAAIDTYLTEKQNVLSPHTVLDYSLTFRRFVEHFGAQKFIGSIAPGDVRVFLATIPGGKKNKANAHIALSALWTHLVNQGFVNDHVLRRVEIAKPEVRAVIPFSQDDVSKLLDASKATGRERPRNTAIIYVLLDTGIRASELTGLTLSGLENNFLRVFGKGSKERRVPITPYAMQKVVAYLDTRPPGKRNTPVFLSEDNLPMTRDGLLKMLVRLGNRAGVRNVHPHKFRHTFAINYLLNGGDPYSLQAILGHSTMDMVKRYLFLTSKDVSAIHARASPLAKWKF